MKCPRCGVFAPSTAAHCVGCGARLHPELPPRVVATPPRRQRGWVVASVLLGVVLLAVAGVAAVLVLQARPDLVAGARQVSPATPGAATATPPEPPASPSPKAVPSSHTAPSPSAPPALSLVEPDTPRDFSAVYAEVGDGVGLVEVETCEGTVTGTGFLLDGSTMATVAHVVLGAEAVTVDIDGQRRDAAVIGLDADRELALLQLERPVRGHHFRWDTDEVTVGQPVAAIGHPLGGPVSLTTGAVSGLDRSAEDAGLALDGLVQTDTAVNQGNSGGPLIDLDGEVVGLVEAKLDGEGLGFAIPAEAAAAVLASWAEQPVRVETGCDDLVASVSEPVYEDVAPDSYEDGDGYEGEWEPPPSGVTVYSTHPDAYAVADAFERYADGINTGDYASAYAVLGASARERTPYVAFVDGNETSVLDLVTVHEVATVGDEVVEVLVTFTSTQAPEDGPDGQPCTDWALRYTMVHDGSGWQVDAVTNEPGSPSPC